MKNHGKNKGEYGYRTSHRKMQLCMVAFGAVMILIQLGARGFTDNSSVKNILTVMAVLSVLPTANVASPLLAAWRYKTPPEAFYSRVHAYEEHFMILYELIITSKEAMMPMDAVIVHPTGIYCYCTSERADAKKGEEYLNGMLTAHRLDPDSKIIKDEKIFFQRLESLKPASEYDDDGSVEYAAELLKQLSM
ncbi:O-linked GlcNAc transferase-like protein [Clostridium sp. AM58-1XD]|uniref:O-linked GlcNAc transferase-like protein n=1 Tax=Clostridium sp. AM58-1XD TaxID=2292307 RepID=UPI000E4D906C|nr:O-linked GlcNAc transferase-like protein [Clostridium sp. AM58-1XD]RGY99397.1 O-linked GlcNAc transferase-like protein [Clostridium sp. AM58-1XD]